MSNNLGLAGEFKLVATNAKTGKSRVLADWFPNLITNQGLNYFGDGDQAITHVQVGSGTAVPNVNDTSLATWVAGTSSSFESYNNNSNSPYQCTTSYTWQFAQGAAAGNLSEVGVGRATSGQLFSRALILDSGGNPTTITVTSIEFLTVYYRLSVYPPLDDVIGNITIAEVDYEYIIRAANVTSWDYPNRLILGGASAWSGNIGLITSSPSGASLDITPSLGGYSNNSHKRSIGLSASISQANTQIRSLKFSWSDLWFQCQFNPTIPKNNTKTFSMSYWLSWARRD